MYANHITYSLILLTVVKTPLEIIGGIASVMQVLQTTLDIAERIKSANDKKKLSMVINRNSKEVASLREIIAIVEGEDALKTEPVLAEIVAIADLATALQELLKSMEDSGFATRVLHGKDQKEELGSLTGEIAKAKSNLTLKIQSAHVGLTMMENKKIVVHMEKLEVVNANLTRLVDDFEGLFIAELVKGREPCGKKIALFLTQ